MGNNCLKFIDTFRKVCGEVAGVRIRAVPAVLREPVAVAVRVPDRRAEETVVLVGDPVAVVVQPVANLPAAGRNVRAVIVTIRVVDDVTVGDEEGGDGAGRGPEAIGIEIAEIKTGKTAVASAHEVNGIARNNEKIPEPIAVNISGISNRKPREIPRNLPVETETALRRDPRHLPVTILVHRVDDIPRAGMNQGIPVVAVLRRAETVPVVRVNDYRARAQKIPVREVCWDRTPRNGNLVAVRRITGRDVADDDLINVLHV